MEWNDDQQWWNNGFDYYTNQYTPQRNVATTNSIGMGFTSFNDSQVDSVNDQYLSTDAFAPTGDYINPNTFYVQKNETPYISPYTFEPIDPAEKFNKDLVDSFNHSYNVWNRPETLYNTPLSPNDEINYSRWKTMSEMNNQMELDEKDYDWRGYFNENRNKPFDPEDINHKFAKPNHPLFSNKSLYHMADGNQGGTFNSDGTFSPGSNNFYSKNELQEYLGENWSALDGRSTTQDSPWTLESEIIDPETGLSKVPTFNNKQLTGKDAEYFKVQIDAEGISTLPVTKTLLSDYEANKEALRQGAKTKKEHIYEWISPDEENNLIKVAGIGAGTIAGGKTGSWAGMAIGGAVGFLLGGVAGAGIGVAWGRNIGWGVGSIAGSIGASEGARRMSGDFKRERSVLEAQHKLNSGEFSTQEEHDELLEQIIDFQNFNKIERFREDQQSISTAIVDGFGDVVVWGAELGAGGKAVTGMFYRQVKAARTAAGASKTAGVTLNSGQMGLARGLNPKATEAWLQTADDLVKAQKFGRRLSIRDKAIAEAIFTGPLRINKKQSKKILELTRNIKDPNARAKQIANLSQSFVYKNQASWMAHGTKRISALRQLMGRNLGKTGTMLGSRFLIAQPRVAGERQTEYIQDIVFENGMFKAQGPQGGTNINTAPDWALGDVDREVRRQAQVLTSIAIEGLGGSLLTHLPKTKAIKALKKAWKKPVDKILKDPAVKIGGAAGINKAIKEFGGSTLGKQLKSGNRFTKKLFNTYGVGTGGGFFPSVAVETAEEYMDLVISSAFDLNKQSREARGMSWAEGVAEALTSPIDNPRDWVIIAGTVGLLPGAGLAVGTLTGAKTPIEQRNFNSLLEGISKIRSEVVTEEQFQSVVASVYGAGRQVYDSVTSDNSRVNKLFSARALSRILDPVATDFSKAIFGGRATDFRNAVNATMDTLMSDNKNLSEQDARNQAIAKVSSAQLVAKQVVSNTAEVNMFNKLAARKSNGEQVLKELIDPRKDGGANLFMDIVETEVAGTKVEIPQARFTVPSEQKEQLLSEAAIQSAVDVGQAEITPTGRIRDPKTFKYLSGRTAEQIGRTADIEGKTDTLSAAKTVLDNMVTEYLDPEATKQIENNSQSIKSGPLRAAKEQMIKLTKRLSPGERNQTEADLKISKELIKKDLKQKLNITGVTEVDPEQRKRMEQGKDYLAGKLLKPKDLEAKLDEFVDNVIDVSMNSGAPVQIRTVKDSVFIGQAVRSTGREGDIAKIEGFNRVKPDGTRVIYISGLAFADDSPSRILNEEQREADIKSKFKKGTNKITSFGADAVRSVVNDLKLKAQNESIDFKQRKVITNMLTELQQIQSSPIDMFVRISQAMEPDKGPKGLQGIADFISPESRSMLNDAIMHEHTDALRNQVAQYMSESEYNTAVDNYTDWIETGGTRALEEYIDVDIPTEFLNEERRIFLEENQVKFYDKKTKTSKMYTFNPEQGEWLNRNNKVIKNQTLIKSLNKRLSDKQLPLEETRSLKNIRKIQGRLNFYERASDAVEVKSILKERLDRADVPFSPKKRKAAENIIKEIEAIEAETGGLNALVISETDLSNVSDIITRRDTFRRFIEENNYGDYTFSASVMGNSDDSGTPLDKREEDSNDDFGEKPHFGSMGKGAISAYLMNKYGSRNGSSLIYSIRSLPKLEEIAKDEDAFNTFRNESNEGDPLLIRRLREALSEDYVDEFTKERHVITHKDVYEFWRLSQSYHLYPFVNQKEITNVQTKEKKMKMFVSNELDMFKLLKRNATINLEGESGLDFENEWRSANTADDYYYLLDSILGIDAITLKAYDNLPGSTEGKILKIISAEKTAASMKDIDWLAKQIYKGTEGKKSQRGGTVLSTLATHYGKAFHLKTQFRTVNQKEQSAILGDSHFDTFIQYYKKNADKEGLTQRQENLMVAYYDFNDNEMVDDASFLKANVDLFESSIDFFKPNPRTESKHYYQMLPKFAEKSKVPLIAQRYYGLNKNDLIKEAKQTRTWIKANFKSKGALSFYEDPVDAIKKMKAKNGQLSMQDAASAHQLIHMPKLIDAIHGNIESYIVSDNSDPKSRFKNIINFIARNSQVSTDGIRYNGPVNVIMVDEFKLKDYNDADGLDGQAILMENILQKISEDLGEGLIKGRSEAGLEIDGNGNVVLDNLKAHISGYVNVDGQNKRILVKTNNHNPTVMLESTSKKNNRFDSQSELKQLIEKVKEYNKGKDYNDQVHQIVFPSGAKFFPGKTTDWKKDVFKPEILKVDKDSSLVVSTNLRHETNSLSQNKMFKQQHAQIGVLNMSATVKVNDTDTITYSDNGIKANELRNKAVLKQLKRIKYDTDKIVNKFSSPTLIEAVLNNKENIFDVRYDESVLEQKNIIARVASVPNINRVALQVLGGLSNTPAGYGPVIDDIGTFKTSRVEANVKFARYNTYTNTKDIEEVKEFINKNRRFFYDMYFIDEDGYPTNNIMLHELDLDNKGNYVIPGEYVINTRIPSGSLASHSFGRLTEPTSKSFIESNIIVTNEKIRISKGEDQDGDKSYTHMMSRKVIKVDNPMYKLEDNQLTLVNENGDYNLTHDYGNWAENETKSESIGSLLNRAMGLEFAIWHTPAARASYDKTGDIPKSAFDADTVDISMKDTDALKSVNVSTVEGFSKIFSIFKIREEVTGIFAKSNSTYSWLSTAKVSLPISPDWQSKDTKFDLEIPSEFNFKNLNAVKTALEIGLNRAIDDNKEGKLFFMNLNKDTAGLASLLFMTNITANDIPLDNSKLREKDSDGNDVSLAVRDINKILKYINSDFMRIGVKEYLLRKEKYNEAKREYNYKYRNEIGKTKPKFSNKYPREVFFKDVFKEWGEESIYFWENLQTASIKFLQYARLMDAPFTAPKTVDEVNYLEETYDSINKFPDAAPHPFFSAAALVDILDTPIMRLSDMARSEYEKNRDQSFMSFVFENTYLNPVKKEHRLARSPEFTNLVKKNIIQRALRSIDSNRSTQALDIFVRQSKAEAKKLFDPKDTTYVLDKKKALIKNYLSTKHKAARFNGKIALIELFRQELNAEIKAKLVNQFKSLSMASKINLTSYMIDEYGFKTTEFSGTIFGYINAEFSKMINKQMPNIKEEINLDAKSFLNELSVSLEREARNLPQTEKRKRKEYNDLAKAISKQATLSMRVNKTFENKVIPVEEQTLPQTKEETPAEETTQEIPETREGVVVSTMKRFTPSILRAQGNKDKVFIFGDNLTGKGKAGQAIIRDEPNAFGIPTKKAPSTNDNAYFTDNEYEQNIKAIDEAINKIPRNKEIVIPEDGLGTGLAQLETRAPKTFEYLNKQIAKLNQIGVTKMPEGESAYGKLPVRVKGIRTNAITIVGSRDLPIGMKSKIKAIAKYWASEGYQVRTGNATGADAAAREGAKEGGKEAFVYGPKDVDLNTDHGKFTMQVMEETHPNPEALRIKGPGVQKIQARNTYQVFGFDLNKPSDLVIVYTKDGATTAEQTKVVDPKTRRSTSGGTGQAIRLASNKGIPVVNLANKNYKKELRAIKDELDALEYGDEVTFSASVTNLNPQNKFIFTPDIIFDWETRLLQHKKRHLYEKNKWNLDKMLKEANVPAVHIKYINGLANKDESLEDIVQEMKRIFERNLYFQIQSPGTRIDNRELRSISKEEIRSAIDGDGVTANQGRNLPYFERRREKSDINDVYNIFTLNIANLDNYLLNLNPGKISYKNMPNYHVDVDFVNQLNWYRVDVKPNSHIALLESQSELFQAQWGFLQNDIANTMSPISYILEVLHEKNTWNKIATEFIQSYADLAGYKLSVPTETAIDEIQRFYFEPDITDAPGQTDLVEADLMGRPNATIYKHYRSIIKHLENYTNSKHYAINSAEFMFDKKDLENKSWSTDAIKLYGVDNISLNIEDAEFNERNAILSQEDVNQHYKKDFIVGNLELETFTRDKTFNPAVNWDVLLPKIKENLNISSFLNLERFRYEKYLKDTDRISNRVNVLTEKYPGLLENGNARFFVHILDYDKDKVWKLINENKYLEAVDAMKPELIRQRAFANDILKHYAIQESINNNINGTANHPLLQTTRQQFGIQDTPAFLKAEGKLNDVALDVLSQANTNVYNQKGEPVKSKFKEYQKIEKIVNRLNHYITLMGGDIYNQYKVLKDLEAISTIEPKLHSSFRKAIRLINGVPTKREAQLNEVEVPYSDRRFSELDFSASVMRQWEYSNIDMYSNMHTMKFGTNLMQEHLVDSARKFRTVKQSGIIEINNLERATLNKTFYVNHNNMTTKELVKKGIIPALTKSITPVGKRKALGRKMRSTLTYLIELYDPDNDDWRDKQVFDPELFLNEHEKKTIEFEERKDGKKVYFFKRKKQKVYFPTMQQRLDEIREETENTKSQYALSFEDKDLETTIAFGKKHLDNQWQRLNEAAISFDTEFIPYRDNYVPHIQLDWSLSEYNNVNRRDTARSELARTYNSWHDLFIAKQILPEYTLDLAEISKEYVNQTARILKNRLSVTGMSMVSDTDMLPMMLFETKDDLGLITEDIAHGLSEKMLKGLRYLEKDKEFKDNPNQNGYERLNNLISQIDPKDYGYRVVPSKYTNFKNVKNIYVKQGTASKIADHIFKDRVRFNEGRLGETLWGKTYQVISNINILGKVASVTGSLFHPIALYESLVGVFGRAKMIAGMFNPLTLKRHTKMYRQMATDPEVLANWSRYGLVMDIGKAPDLQYERYHTWINKLSNSLINVKVPGTQYSVPFIHEIGKGLKGLQYLKHKSDQLMWEVMLPMMKVSSANHLLEQIQEELTEEGIPYQIDKVKSDISAFVNDAFGGQEWEQYIGANPAALAHWNNLLFAPDWTLSALNVAGISHFGPLRWLGSPTSDIHARLRTDHYWGSMAVNVLVLLPNALQAMIYAYAAAAGDLDDEDELWAINNEMGKKGAIDITPLLRSFESTKKYTQMGSSKSRRVYIQFGKQVYEVATGWLDDPLATAMGKTSIGMKLFMEQGLNLYTPSWQTPWAGHENFWESLFSIDGKPAEGRLASIATKFIPFSLHPVFNELLGAETVKPAALFAPTKYGMSEGKAMTLIKDYAHYYVEGKARGFFENNTKDQTLRHYVSDVLDAAYKNGYDIRDLLKKGEGQARIRYYAEFHQAQKENDFEAMTEAAKRLKILNGEWKSLKGSIERRYEKIKGKVKTPDSLLNKGHRAWLAGIREAREEGRKYIYNYEFEKFVK